MSKRKKTARNKGQGTLERKSNGIYLARWIVEGRKYSRSTGTTIREEAERILADFVKPYQSKSKIKRLAYLAAEMKGEQDRLTAEELRKPAMRIDEALERYFADVNADKVTDGTVNVYHHRFRRFMDFIKSRKGDEKVVELRHVTPDMARDFLEELKKENVSDNTYNGYLSFLRTMWRRLFKAARITVNPWEEYRKRRNIKANKRENFTRAEIRKVLDSTKGDWRTIWIIGYATSLRVSDCSKLKWESINLDSNIITVVPYKTRLKKPAPMSIPIHQDLRAVLLSVPVEERKGFVVPECAAAYDNGTLTYKLKNILEACGIKTSKKDENGKTICLKSFHSTRSFAATEMANAGIPLTDICSMLNHSSVETTEGYLRKDRSRLSHCVEVLPSMFGENVAPKVSLSIDEDVADLLKSKLLQGESISEGLKRIIGLAETRNDESSIVEYTLVETPPVKTTLAPTFISENQTVEYPLAPVSLTENPLKVIA
ncbi:MAG: tyrosine-type recombinase/integrase [Oscillospiraceae bacterium]|nr:tyrosine-type recombinase/integrase [Oscillospiraceae bacterium]